MKQKQKINFFILAELAVAVFFITASFLSLSFPGVAKAQGGTGTLGQYCNEATGEDCQAGLNCVNNVCVDPNAGSGGTVGQHCDLTLTPQIDCRAGLNCVNYKCVDPSAGGGGPTGGGPTQGNCPDGLVQGNGGVCLPPKNCDAGIACTSTLSEFLLTLTKILLSFAGVIAVVMLVIGGYWYMAAGGNEELAEKGKKTILNFVLGLAVIILAYTIVSVVSSTLTGADKLLQ